MNSSMIGKIEKARRYAEEPSRVEFHSLDVHFRGDHDIYHVRFEGEEWSCSCHSYGALQAGTCSHIMALERLLGVMAPSGAARGTEVSLV